MEPCLFCLEIQKPNDEVILLILRKYPNGTCNCKIYTHVSCWVQYFRYKGRIECPICHTLVQGPAARPYVPPPLTEQPIQIVIDNRVNQYRPSSRSQSTGTVQPRVDYINARRTACFFISFSTAITMLYISRN